MRWLRNKDLVQTGLAPSELYLGLLLRKKEDVRIDNSFRLYEIELFCKKIDIFLQKRRGSVSFVECLPKNGQQKCYFLVEVNV